MFLKSVHIWNYRLLLNNEICFDDRLTLFVGKNNTGKTSIITFMQQILSGKKTALKFDDYPIIRRKELYNLVWRMTKGELSIDELKSKIPTTKIQLDIDYSKESEDEFLGSLSPFIIDLDIDNNIARILVEYQSAITEEVITEIKNNLSQLKVTNTDSIQTSASSSELLVVSKYIDKNFETLFSITVKAINPSNQRVFQVKEMSQLRDLFIYKKISAERGLDESDANIKKPIEKVMERIFQNDVMQYESSINETINRLKTYIEEESNKAQDKVNQLLEPIISRMIKFGYPTAEDMQLKARTQILLKNNIINDTDLTYSSEEDGEILPSSHNGLGYKNLIKIVFLLHEFSQELKESAQVSIPLLFIEEPEAHMHPQLQAVFVQYINEIFEDFSGNPIQIVISTHSSYVANTVPFQQVRYLRRSHDFVTCKNLNDFFNSSQSEEDNNLKFLHKYLTISRCDLYFCDKAILVEGAAERLLIPDMIKKCEDRGIFKDTLPSLSSQYYSLIEVGGAYAHKFFDFIDFLGIPTLILTDIDFVNEHGKKCLKEEAIRSSNATIAKWCHDTLNIDLSKTVKIEDVHKLLSDNLLTNGLRHIEFQKEENGCHPRSLEEAIMNVNRDLYNIEDSETDFTFNSDNEKKTDFALNLLMGEAFVNYNIPSYIVDGLIWLNEQNKMPPSVQVTAKEKFKRKLTIKTIPG